MAAKEADNVTEAADAPAQTAAVDTPTDDWQPQQFEPDTGVFLTGDFPTNHRLRAEALAKARRKHDPDGIISDELIADTAERLKAEREAE